MAHYEISWVMAFEAEDDEDLIRQTMGTLDDAINRGQGATMFEVTDLDAGPTRLIDAEPIIKSVLGVK